MSEDSMERNRAAVVLDPDAVYQRQETLGVWVPRSVCVIGLGGTGSWVALQLALLGATELTLIDDDRVEIHNLNRLPLPPETVGQPKVMAVAAEIVRLRPSVLVVPLFQKWDGDPDVFDDADVVFDCTDNNRTQKRIAEAAGSRYYRSGCGANQITAVKRLPWGDDGADGGYGEQGTPIWVGPAVLSAVRAVGLMAANWPEVSDHIAPPAPPPPEDEDEGRGRDSEDGRWSDDPDEDEPSAWLRKFGVATHREAQDLTCAECGEHYIDHNGTRCPR